MSTEQPGSFGRHYALVAFKIAVSIVLLSILFSRIDVSKLWASTQHASIPWLLAALVVYGFTVAASVWRWHLLLKAQGVDIETNRLAGSYLVALFFNNFLPSNIGGDVIRIRDTSRPAGSLTLATAVVLVDRGLGLMGLVLVAACGATLAATTATGGALPIAPAWLWAGFLTGVGLSAPAVLSPHGFGRILQPLRIIHPEWIDRRIENVTAVLARFRNRPAALVGCFGGAVFVQASTVAYYVATAYALHIAIGPWDLAVIVPLSFLLQMLPVSINGFGVREAAFTMYFSRLRLPIESALLVSLVPTALVMLFSLSGAAVYVGRKR
jgi:glycosyltransferase 2 family protein